MLVAGAEVSFTFGHSALTRLYDGMRLARGAPRAIHVGGDGDSEAFRATYDAAMAAAAAASAATAGAGANAGAGASVGAGAGAALGEASS